jgi:hypothetical protein
MPGVAMRRQALLLVVLVAAGCVSLGQVSGQGMQSAEPGSTLRGTVVNAVTLAPISRALVYSADNRFATLTDGEGHFEFTLPKASSDNEGMVFFEGPPRQLWSVVGPGGSVSLMARRPGFLDDPNDRRQVRATPSGVITISLMPEGLIKGRVIVSEADPALGITVQLFTRQVQDGMPRWLQASAVRANADGEFRFAELLPGTYKLATNEFMDNDPAVTVPGGQVYGFPPVYYPGVSDFAAAGTIQLTAGQTVQADLSLTRQPYFPVRIPVANADQNGGMNITVSLQGHRGPGYSLGYNAEKQRIEGALPNGNYRVETTMTNGQNSATGAVNIAVAGAAADGPVMTLIPSSSISVHVSEEFTAADQNGRSTWNFAGRSFQVHGPRSYLQVRAEGEDDFEQRMSAFFRPPTGPNDDSLVIDNLAPGRYRLRLSSARGYVAAATMGGVDLLHEALVVAPGSTTSIEIKMRDDTAEIEGTLTGLTAESIAGAEPTLSQAYVYCVPLPESPGELQQLGVSFPEGKFTSQTMVPGTYRVLAFKNPQPNLPYRDAEAMKAYETMGPVVHLSPRQKTNVQAQIISSSE